MKKLVLGIITAFAIHAATPTYTHAEEAAKPAPAKKAPKKGKKKEGEGGDKPADKTKGELVA